MKLKNWAFDIQNLVFDINSPNILNLIALRILRKGLKTLGFCLLSGNRVVPVAAPGVATGYPFQC